MTFQHDHAYRHFRVFSLPYRLCFLHFKSDGVNDKDLTGTKLGLTLARFPLKHLDARLSTNVKTCNCGLVVVSFTTPRSFFRLHRNEGWCKLTGFLLSGCVTNTKHNSEPFSSYLSPFLVSWKLFGRQEDAEFVKERFELRRQSVRLKIFHFNRIRVWNGNVKAQTQHGRLSII